MKTDPDDEERIRGAVDQLIETRKQQFRAFKLRCDYKNNMSVWGSCSFWGPSFFGIYSQQESDEVDMQEMYFWKKVSPRLQLSEQQFNHIANLKQQLRKRIEELRRQRRQSMKDLEIIIQNRSVHKQFSTPSTSSNTTSSSKTSASTSTTNSNNSNSQTTSIGSIWPAQLTTNNNNNNNNNPSISNVDLMSQFLPAASTIALQQPEIDFGAVVRLSAKLGELKQNWEEHWQTWETCYFEMLSKVFTVRQNAILFLFEAKHFENIRILNQCWSVLNGNFNGSENMVSHMHSPFVMAPFFYSWKL